jgi:orotate phosphoribosyltransferase
MHKPIGDFTEQHKDEFARFLYANQMLVVDENPSLFRTLKTGVPTPYYLKMDEASSSPLKRAIVAANLLELAGLQDTAIAGDPERESGLHHIVGASDEIAPYVSTMSDKSNLSYLGTRRTILEYGGRLRLIGKFSQGERVGVVDSSITSTPFKHDVVETLKGKGLQVVRYFSVLDRQEGSNEALAEATDVPVISAIRIAEVVSMLHAEGELSIIQFENVKAYLEQYGTPGAADSMGSAL